MSFFSFLKQFLKNPISVGAVAPVGKKAIKDTLRHIDFSKDLVIVEYGAGPGNYTQALLNNMSAGSRLIAFEIDQSFDVFLNNIKDSRLKIIYNSSETVGDIVGNNEVDVILSTMPLTMMDVELKHRIFEKTSQVLKPGGIFLKVQYSSISISFIKHYFNFINKSYSWLNIPPVAIMKFIK